jgi:hypothetical protein
MYVSNFLPKPNQPTNKQTKTQQIKYSSSIAQQSTTEVYTKETTKIKAPKGI